MVNSLKKQQWTHTRRLINATFSCMLSVCSFGFANFTRGNIRLADGLASNTLTRIHTSLPVLPFYDNARYAIPAWDGHACAFRLTGRYED